MSSGDPMWFKSSFHSPEVHVEKAKSDKSSCKKCNKMLGVFFFGGLGFGASRVLGCLGFLERSGAQTLDFTGPMFQVF